MFEKSIDIDVKDISDEDGQSKVSFKQNEEQKGISFKSVSKTPKKSKKKKKIMRQITYSFGGMKHPSYPVSLKSIKKLEKSAGLPDSKPHSKTVKISNSAQPKLAKQLGWFNENDQKDNLSSSDGEEF